MKDKNDIRAYELIQQIKSGQRDPTTIPPNERRALEQLLLLENYNKHQLALFFKVSDRTIRRDLRQYNEDLYENLIEDSRHLVGQFVSRAEFCWYQLTRILRDSKLSATDKIRVIGECEMVNTDVIEKLQKLGLLPLKSGIKNLVSLTSPAKTKQTKVLDEKLSPRNKKIEAILQMLTPMDRDRLIDLLKDFIIVSEDENSGSVESSEKAFDDFINKKIEKYSSDDLERPFTGK